MCVQASLCLYTCHQLLTLLLPCSWCPLQHDVLAALAKGTVVIATNHSNSERAYLRDRLQARLKRELDAFDGITPLRDVVVSERDADPLLVV